jgi:hypothetical protein
LRLDLVKKIGKRWLCSIGAAALTCVAVHRVMAQEATSAAAPKTGSSSQTATSAHSKSASTPASARRTGQHSKRARRRKTMARGQQKIDPERAQEIQEALVREHYLSNAAAGTWNQASEDAMRRYQADHGWQSKTVPDSRALISLGLGPNHDHLLNPESAMTMASGPATSQAASTARVRAVSGPSSGSSPSLPAKSSDTSPATTGLGDSSGPQK